MKDPIDILMEEHMKQEEFFDYWGGVCEACKRPRAQGSDFCSAAHMDVALWHSAKENEQLRKILWLRHGCPFYALYGDDGEMSCNACHIDFKRMHVSDIIKELEKSK